MERPQAVLVVDDERNIRFTLRETLESAGYEVAVALSGEEALESFAARPFDVVLLDLRMSGLDGIEVLRRMRRLRPEARVVIVTAHGTVDSAVLALKLGAVDYVQKPFTPDEIRGVVARALAEIAVGEDADYGDLTTRARAAARKGRLHVALFLARAAIAAEPERPEALCLYGAALEMLGHVARVQSFYRAAIAIDATWQPAHVNLRQSAEHPHERPPLLGDEE